MRGEQSRDMDMVALGGALKGLALITVVGGLGAWLVFVQGDRLRKAEAARRLEGTWDVGEGAGFQFDFGRGHTGTVKAWGTDVGFTEHVRIVWRKSREAVIAIGPTEGREDYYLVTFTGDRDTVVMRGEGEGAGVLVLRRSGHAQPG